MNENNARLQAALARVFQDTSQLGFWDGQNQRIHGKLTHDPAWQWQIDPDRSDRYGLFCLSAILLAKVIYRLDTSASDPKIIAYLQYIQKSVRTYQLPDVTYGAWNCLVLGQRIYPQLALDQEIKSLFEFIDDGLEPITDNQHALVLIGGAYHDPQDDESQGYWRNLTLRLLKAQDAEGFFQTGDLRAFHHQRVMYVLWSLAVMSQRFLKNEIREAIKRSLRSIWATRRQTEDNAFLWHPAFYWAKSSAGIKVPMYLPLSAEHLFECHQTFFANAVGLYQHYFQTNDFEEERSQALQWIFGTNRAKTDLVGVTGLDVPARMMTAKGTLDANGNNFKGSYEIGSYILALAKG